MIEVSRNDRCRRGDAEELLLLVVVAVGAQLTCCLSSGTLIFLYSRDIQILSFIFVVPSHPLLLWGLFRKHYRLFGGSYFEGAWRRPDHR